MGLLRGVIQSVSPEYIKVLVSDASEEACGACALRETCASSHKAKGETDEGRDLSARIITVYDYPTGLRAGDAVTLEEAPGLRLKGAFYAFMLPLVLLVAAAVILSKAGVSEAAMAGLLMGVIALYGLAIWLMRERFKRILYYRIEPASGVEDRICG